MRCFSKKQLIGLLVVLASIGSSPNSFAQEEDLSGYWLIDEDEKYPEGMPRLLRITKQPWIGTEPQEVWTAEFTRPAECPNGTAKLPYYFQQSPYGSGGEIARCSNKEFMNKCSTTIANLKEPDPRDFYYAHVPAFEVNTSRKEKTISGKFASEVWKPIPGKPGECARATKEETEKWFGFIKTNEKKFQLKLTSCPPTLSMVEPSIEETNAVDKALTQWVEGKEKQIEQDLKALRNANKIVDGAMRADAARCIPREVIDSTLKLQTSNSYNDCTTMCFKLDEWFDRIASDKTQNVPMADFRTRCIAQICTGMKVD